MIKVEIFYPILRNNVHYWINANVMDDHPLFRQEMTKTSRKTSRRNRKGPTI